MGTALRGSLDIFLLIYNGYSKDGACMCFIYLFHFFFLGASGVANRFSHQPAGQLPLHPGQQHRPTGRKNSA